MIAVISCQHGNKDRNFESEGERKRLVIRTTVKIKMPRQKVKEALEILMMVAERTRVRPGCISCRIFHDAQEKQVIMLDEMWSTQEDLDDHLRSDEYRHVLLVLEMAEEKPEILFQPLSNPAGLETIEKARGCMKNDEG